MRNMNLIRKHFQACLLTFLLLLTVVDCTIVVGVAGWYLGSLHKEFQFFLTITAMALGQFIGALVVNIISGVLAESLGTAIDTISRFFIPKKGTLL